MFVISQAKTVKQAVVVELLDETGALKKHPFTVEAKRFDQAEWDALYARHDRDDTDLSMRDRLLDNAALFAEVVVGWEGVASPAGEVVPYSPETLAALVTGPDGPAVSRAMHDTLNALRYGIAARKN